jgi:hypothetical protein
MTKKNERKPVVQHSKRETDRHHEHSRMDTNGFTGHEALHQQAEKRFLLVALQYCSHIDGGDHAECQDVCDFHERMLDAYDLLITT